MNVQLRNGNGYPSRGSMPLPSMGRMGDSNINPTTIWTPQTGFLNQPGTLAKGYQFQPQVTSVYDVPGLLLPAPDCTQAAGGAFVSSGCVDQALAVEQENFARTAAYNAGTLKLPLGDPAANTLAAEGANPPAQGTTPASTPKATPPQTGGTTAASTNAGGSTSNGGSGGGTATVTPSTVNPALYWIAGLTAVALIIAAVK